MDLEIISSPWGKSLCLITIKHWMIYNALKQSRTLNLPIKLMFETLLEKCFLDLFYDGNFTPSNIYLTTTQKGKGTVHSSIQKKKSFKQLRILSFLKGLYFEPSLIGKPPGVGLHIEPFLRCYPQRDKSVTVFWFHTCTMKYSPWDPFYITPKTSAETILLYKITGFLGDPLIHQKSFSTELLIKSGIWQALPGLET